MTIRQGKKAGPINECGWWRLHGEHGSVGDSEFEEVVVDRVKALKSCIVVISHETWDLCGRRRRKVEEVTSIVYSARPWDDGGLQ